MRRSRNRHRPRRRRRDRSLPPYYAGLRPWPVEQPDPAPGRPSGWRVRLGRVVGTLGALALGAFSLYLGGRAAVMDYLLAGDGPVARAEVVRLGQRGKGGQALWVVETFVTADGRRVTVDVDQFEPPTPSPGDVRLVRYDPGHPTWCVRELAHGTEYGDLMLFFPLGLIPLGYAVSEIYPAARRASGRAAAWRRRRSRRERAGPGAEQR